VTTGGPSVPRSPSWMWAAVTGDVNPKTSMNEQQLPGVIVGHHRRLAPARMVVLGGAAAVSDQVEDALAAYLRA
jgi:hypothetical protein